MLKIYPKANSSIPLGRSGEENARQICFDISGWRELYGDGVVQLLHQRPSDADPYPVNVAVDGSTVLWTVTLADTSEAGKGKAELQYRVGDTVAKSIIWATFVGTSLGTPTDTPPEAQQGWVDKVLAAGTSAENAAQKAEEAAIRQPKIDAGTMTWWQWDAELGEYVDTGIGASGGDSAGINVTGATVGQIARISAVDENGVPTAWEAADLPGGGEKEWELLYSIDLEEETGAVEYLNEDLSQYRALFAQAKFMGTTNNTSAQSGRFGFNNASQHNNGLAYFKNMVLTSASDRYASCFYGKDVLPIAGGIALYASGGGNPGDVTTVGLLDFDAENVPINRFYARPDGNMLFGVGTKFRIYGRK